MFTFTFPLSPFTFQLSFPSHLSPFSFLAYG